MNYKSIKLFGCLFFGLLFLTTSLVSGSFEHPFQNIQEEKTEKSIDYNSVRIKKFPIAMQCWTYRKYTFFETLEKVEALGIHFLQAYPGQALSKDEPTVRFNQNLDKEHITEIKKRLKKYNINLVAYGVTPISKNEKEIDQVFEFAKTMGIQTIITEPQYDDYSLIKKYVKKYGINVAIHNHPEPSKYAHPEVVLKHVQNQDKRFGACADTGHWMRSGVSPVKALRLLKGRIQDVHLKDLNEFGSKKAYDVPFGQGKANIPDILAELTLQNYKGYLTIEYENKEEVMHPEPSIKKGIEYIKSITYYQDYEEILKCHNRKYTKHGWNHYGPGYFILNPDTGVLKSQGGMGLFWYSEQEFSDFILELDYKCSNANTNSGVFLRVPEIPTNNNYIYHSFEVQINDSGQGIHKTAAIYDAKAPEKDVFNKEGEWNHFKIIFKGNHIKVELNNHLIVDWDAEPKGKVKNFYKEGYIGLQNHDSHSPVYFKNIYIKELK